MEGHSGQECNWIVTSIPLDRTACYSFVNCMPFDRAFMAFDRTRLSIVPGIRSYSTFGRTPHSVVLPIRWYSPFGGTENSVVLPIRSYRAFGRTPVVVGHGSQSIKGELSFRAQFQRVLVVCGPQAATNFNYQKYKSG